MRNVIRSLGILGLALAGIAGHAQASDLMQVSVPFAFEAGGKAMPAGNYRIMLDQRSDLMTISGGGVLAAILGTAPGDQLYHQRSFLRFERDGDKWLLHRISFAGTAQRVELAKSLRK